MPKKQKNIREAEEMLQRDKRSRVSIIELMAYSIFRVCHLMIITIFGYDFNPAQEKIPNWQQLIAQNTQLSTCRSLFIWRNQYESP